MSAPGIHHYMASSPLMKSQYLNGGVVQTNKTNTTTASCLWRLSVSALPLFEEQDTGTLASSSSARAPMFTVQCTVLGWCQTPVEPTLAPPLAWTEERHQLTKDYKFSCCCAATPAPAVMTAWRGRSVQNWFLTPACLSSSVQQLGLFEELHAVTAWCDGRNSTLNTTTTGWELRILIKM